ncbi:MAG: TIGR03087 family PEP-CTERM/XrtA system glycosyltransferase [Parasphingorhabdus sp.]|nr:TIGR03087 family PEP-CTERM/XrtA system glycosyltransferase [Parasphingorhabdus sp.]
MRPQILFLAHRVPWPPNRGDRIRSFHILSALTEFADVHLACLSDDLHEPARNHPLRERLASCAIFRCDVPRWRAGLAAIAKGVPVSLTAFESPALHSHIEQLLSTQQIDTAFVFSGQMAQYIADDFTGRFIMDFVDVDSAKFADLSAAGSGPMAWINRREAALLSAFEQRTARRADIALFVSDAEAKLFTRRSGEAAQTLENGIDTATFDPTGVRAQSLEHGGPLILFTGQMDYPPNIGAVSSFANIAMPEILRACPSARFAIVGRMPTPEVRALDGLNGTRVVGEVADVRPWLARADIVVAPLRIARGIQNKVLEAMAMARPVVLSPAAAEGIDAEDGKHFLIAKDAATEAAVVVSLLKDITRANPIGQAARKHVCRRYSWDQQLRNLPELCGVPAISKLVQSA